MCDEFENYKHVTDMINITVFLIIIKLFDFFLGKNDVFCI